MTGSFDRLLARFGQSVTLTPGDPGPSLALRAFLQPILKRREALPVTPSPLGAVSQKRWLYLGAGDQALDTLHRVMLEGLPTGLKPAELRWEETAWDEATSMFLRRGSLSCSAYFVATATEEGAWLTDFILKGVVTK